MICHIDDYFFYDDALMGAEPTIVEIGVFTVEKAIKLRERYPTARALLIEGDPVNFRALTTRCRENIACSAFECANLALAERNEPVVFYHYQHEQFHSTFPRHISEPDKVKLIAANKIDGITLEGILHKFSIARLDLLLLNCEGAEIFALEELSRNDKLRPRIRQICTSAHFKHIQIYPEAAWNAMVHALGNWYDIQSETPVPNIPYYLFRAKP